MLVHWERYKSCFCSLIHDKMQWQHILNIHRLWIFLSHLPPFMLLVLSKRLRTVETHVIWRLRPLRTGGTLYPISPLEQQSWKPHIEMVSSQNGGQACTAESWLKGSPRQSPSFLCVSCKSFFFFFPWATEISGLICYYSTAYPVQN